MSTDSIGVLIPIVVPIAVFIMIFGIRYLENKENLSMIEKGLVPPVRRPRSSHPLQVLKWGLLFMGVGLGLVCALFISSNTPELSGEMHSLVYIAMGLIGGGLGLLLTFFISRKYKDAAPSTNGDSNERIGS